MKMQSILKSALVLAMLGLGINSSFAQADSSKICSGQATTLTAPTAPGGQTYTYQWTDMQSNTSAGTSAALALDSTGTDNNTAAPIIRLFKLVVTQTGGASCPSTDYIKALIIYPRLKDTAITANAFYCLGSPMNIVMTATAKTNNGANATPTTGPGTSPLNYGAYAFSSWSPAAISPNTVTTTSVTGDTYTINSANFPSSAGTTTYTVHVAYTDILVGTVAGIAKCASNGTGNVIVNSAPTINSSTVTTTFQ